MRNKLSYTLCIFLSISFLFFKSNAGSLVVYWGQNGGDGKLIDTCNTGLFQIINIAFLSTFGNGRTPQINLASHCQPNSCQAIGGSIKNCQNKGIKVSC